MVTIDCKYTKKNSTCKNKNQNNKHLQCENNIFYAMQMPIYSMPSDYKTTEGRNTPTQLELPVNNLLSQDILLR